MSRWGGSPDVEAERLEAAICLVLGWLRGVFNAEPTAAELEAALDRALRDVREAMSRYHQAEALLTAEYGPRLQ